MKINYPDPEIKYTLKDVYPPSDDSYLMIDYLKKNITRNYFDDIEIQNIKNVLDMGTGSGIIAIFLLIAKQINKNFTTKIYASDIHQKAIISAKKNEKFNNFTHKIRFLQSDLFNSFSIDLRNKFDIILYNPPYLPSIDLDGEIFENNNHKRRDYSWNGGVKGYENFINFLEQVKPYLNKGNKSYIYYICSSRVNVEELYQKVSMMGFKNIPLERKHILFEDILLNRLEVRFS